MSAATMPLLLRNAAVLDTEAGLLLPEQDVLLRDGVIAELGRGLHRPEARPIALGGRTLMPGLIDCHVHVCADGMVGYPTLFPSMVAARAAKLLRETLLRGFTTIRDAGGADAGFRQAVAQGLFPGPRMFIAGRPLSQTGGHGDSRNVADFCPGCSLRSEQNMMVIADGVDAVRKAA